MRRLAIVLLPLCLSGCGLPPAISIASFALDGFSYLTSGKSVSDHALSVAAGQDCALLRVVENTEVCRDFKDGEEPFLVTESQAWAEEQNRLGYDDTSDDPIFGWQPADSSTRVAVDDSPVAEPGDPRDAQLPVVARSGFASPAEGSFVQVAYDPPSAEADFAAPPFAPSDPDQRLLVIGSFAHQTNARNLILRWPGFELGVLPATVGDMHVFRVVTDPLPVDEVAAKRERLRRAGIAAAWSLRLCAAHRSGPDCVVWFASES